MTDTRLQSAELLVNDLMNERDLDTIHKRMRELADLLRAMRKAQVRPPRGNRTPERHFVPLWGSHLVDLAKPPKKN